MTMHLQNRSILLLFTIIACGEVFVYYWHVEAVVSGYRIIFQKWQDFAQYLDNVKPIDNEN